MDAMQLTHFKLVNSKCHLVGQGKNGNQTWWSLKSALPFTKENAKTKSDILTGDGFSM